MLVQEIEDYESIDDYKNYLLKYENKLAVLEYWDDNFNLGNLKYMIFSGRTDPLLISEMVDHINSKIKDDINVYITKYSKLYEIIENL